MGCDIHIVLERRFEPGGDWVGVRSFDGIRTTAFDADLPQHYVWFAIRDRNYALFGDLAGVRGEKSEIGFEARGMPEDMSLLSKYLLDVDLDCHSHSWLTMAELRPILQKHFAGELMKWRLEGRFTDLQDPIRAFVHDDICPDNEHEYRLVFAFDN